MLQWPRTSGLRHFATVTVGLLSAIPASAEACTICIGFPAKTDADHLIDSHCVILARDDPDDRFTYVAVEVLKGRFDGKPINLLVDSVTRRQLAADKERNVVLVQEADGGTWRSLGVASAEYEAVVRRIVVFSPQWQGQAGRLRRTQFFLPLFGDDDPALYKLAYLEMGRAPYSVIKNLAHNIDRNEIVPMLDRWQYIEWRSLAILMLAHAGVEKDLQSIVDSFHAAERLGLTTNLAAWATAAIELQGAAAVGFIRDRYFRDASRSREELEAVVKALSLHGREGHLHLRDQIIASYEVLLNIRPEMTPLAAADVLAWKRSDLATLISGIDAGDRRFDSDEKQTIRQYLQMAASPAETAQIDD